MNQKNSLTIGNLELKSKVILAPMAGITSFSYRKFYSKFNIGLFYTEMISDCGLIYNNKRTKLMLKHDDSDRPLALQLFGGSQETLLKAIDIIQSDKDIVYDILDINLACPVPKVTKNNGGSTWLKDVKKLKEVMTEIVKKSDKPVSCKIRLGYDSDNCYEIAKALEEAGVSLLSIHCRTKKEMYSGQPHYEAISNMKNVISIPFFVSGNIFTLEDAKKALEITKADGVLVARGGIGNPNLVIDLNNYFENKDEIEPYTFKKQVEYLKDYASLLKEEVCEKRAVSILKGIAPKFFLGFKECKELRSKISSTIETLDDLFNLIKEYENNA